ncbi:hypothetical protein [Rubritalea tangerina]
MRRDSTSGNIEKALSGEFLVRKCYPSDWRNFVTRHPNKGTVSSV